MSPRKDTQDRMKLMKFVDTKEIVFHEKTMIQNSKEHLYILSPYLWISPSVEKLLEKCKAKVSIVCRGENLHELEYEKIERIKNANPGKIKLYCAEKLHAKMMVNENGYALVSSKNLYLHSEQNYEAGVFFNDATEKTKELYDMALKFCQGICKGLEECVEYPNQIEKQHKPLIVAEPSPKYNALGFEADDSQDEFGVTVKEYNDLVDEYNNLLVDYNQIRAENEEFRKKPESGD